MKQILQNLKNGETTLVDLPCPRFSSGNNLIKASTSLISVGSERILEDFSERQPPPQEKTTVGLKSVSFILTPNSD